MSLNSEQMLPARVRKMRQMEDLLNVEDIILIEIERIIDEMYGAAALLHEELVNEAWLKEKLDARTGADTTVEADADKLLATITLDVSKIVGVDMKDIDQGHSFILIRLIMGRKNIMREASLKRIMSV